MKTKKKIKWWKVVLLGAVSALFLWMLIEILPPVFYAHDSFEASYSGLDRVELYSDGATLYHFYLCFALFIASVFAISTYGLFRCFCPAKISAENADASMRLWRRVTYTCLAVLAICVVLLFLYFRTRRVYYSGIANGGEWTTAADLIIPGWLGNGVVLSISGAVFSMIRRREMRRAVDDFKNDLPHIGVRPH